MTTVTSEEVRDSLGELINRVKYRHERMKVTRRGKPVAALVPVEDLELLEQLLEALEEKQDIPVVRERLQQFKETGDGIPWEALRAKLGL
jgi:prevent-host-death family protein